ncbi:UBX domain-containing protein 7 [Neolecta irregularis DAH-3]|uniref:UBX domain-containing protein 7 n=1 Tax=Neolecta irregularis (strain DAH-3) TaxID=1198029 RepID=A0A1U7LKB0_NEOID|nr:UBX domain-containing protein 7 [Neolecta irregularis DAH-3]|eukprot:OLL23084.1 UBX domain-containing protein 7 [Neolecta irregularis DAH-3]
MDHFKATLELEASEKPPAVDLIRSLLAAQQSFRAPTDQIQPPTSNVQTSVEESTASESQTQDNIQPTQISENAESQMEQREGVRGTSLQDQLNERRQRIESNQTSRKGKQPDSGAPNGEPRRSASHLKYLEDLQTRQKHAAEERKAILAQIQSDKEERAARNWRNKSTTTEQQNLQPSPTARRPWNSIPVTALNIRLINGSSLKTRMANEKTLSDVRKYIDEHRTDGEIPYTLVEAHPTRQFTIADEQLTLQELGLHPSTTLILKSQPERLFADAYDPTYYSSGILSTAWAFVSGLVTSLWWQGTAIRVPEIPQQAEPHVDYEQEERNRSHPRTVWDNGNSIEQEPPPQD